MPAAPPPPRARTWPRASAEPLGRAEASAAPGPRRAPACGRSSPAPPEAGRRLPSETLIPARAGVQAPWRSRNPLAAVSGRRVGTSRAGSGQVAPRRTRGGLPASRWRLSGPFIFRARFCCLDGIVQGLPSCSWRGVHTCNSPVCSASQFYDLAGALFALVREGKSELLQE